MIIANGKIAALEGQITTQGDSPSPITTSSKTGQTIGITVAITLVVVGAIWMLMRRASAKTVSAVGISPPAKYNRRTSLMPSSLMRGTRRLFSRSMAGTSPSEVVQDSSVPYAEPPSANDNTDESDQVSFRNDSEYNPRFGSLVPTNSAIARGHQRRAINANQIGIDVSNAAAALMRAKSLQV